MKTPHIQSDYHHVDKRVVPQAPHETNKGILKYYLIERAQEPISAEIAGKARAFVEVEVNSTLLDSDYGFVIVHKCGLSFYFLLVSVWRGNNEIWEAVYYLKGDMPDFEIFKPAYTETSSPLRPTFCVWEQAVVAHESNCWIQFLISKRSEADIEHWRKDMYKGLV